MHSNIAAGVLTGAETTSGGGKATTTPAPAAATNGAISQQPMAIGMVAAIGAAMFI